MLNLTFKQSSAELMVRSASTIIFNTLVKTGNSLVRLSELAENPQYGFTASASFEEVGVKFVRITDLKDGGINWDTVPYCKCDQPEKYLIYPDDILFARTGATTGKTHIVKESPQAVFASYLIRIRPKHNVVPEYLYSFFQSDSYWSQILEEKEGSAQPNVNGKKLINILVPVVNSKVQVAISNFLEVVRRRQDGSWEKLPELPPPLEEQRQIVARVEELVGKIEEVRSLRQKALEEISHIIRASQEKFFANTPDSIDLGNVSTVIDPNPSHRYPIYIDNGIPIISTVDFVGDNEISTKNAKHIPFSFYEDTIEKFGIGEGDIIFSRKGKVGYARQHPANVKLAMTHTLCVIKPDRNKVLPRYLLHFTRSPVFINYLMGTMNPNVGVPTLGLGVIRSAPFNLPPLPEQHRIVTYLDELQTQVDTMKKLREEAIKEHDALLPSILDKAFKGEL